MVEGAPLQIIRLNQDENKVDVDEENLKVIEKNCRAYGGSMEVAVLAVMGAFRTGKSFALDIMLRFLRSEAAGNATQQEGPPRGNGQAYPVPTWLSGQSSKLEGSTDTASDGFRFKGGMDKCTEGIWIWSKPFKRTVNGKESLLLLMDTQGAWDSEMTKEQSATVFGLTALLSSKLIYNISMQIQEDKVENLGFFMNFAQGALRTAADKYRESGDVVISEEEIEKPFQSLDFLVRDWRNFREEWSVDDCEKQMKEHLQRHLNPKQANEQSTTTALKRMFRDIGVWCLPHPGFAIEKESWSGDVAEIQDDFVRFTEVYMNKIFGPESHLDTKRILGAPLSAFSFSAVVRNFVAAFQDVQCHAQTFTQAVQTATMLTTQDQLQQFYRNEMEKAIKAHSTGMPPDVFLAKHEELLKELQAKFKKSLIFGSASTREDAWTRIMEGVMRLKKRFEEDNGRNLEKALSGWATWALVGVGCFILDRISDFACDWWSERCRWWSQIFLIAYLWVSIFIGICAYFVWRDQGKFVAMMAFNELGKEMVRHLQWYSDFIADPQFVNNMKTFLGDPELPNKIQEAVLFRVQWARDTVTSLLEKPESQRSEKPESQRSEKSEKSKSKD